MTTELNCISQDQTFPFIDTLFDYGTFLANAKSKGCIGNFKENFNKEKVAIIGAGLSGLIAARELLKAGVKNVTLFEANTFRSGGRLLSQRFDENLPQYIEEMGAMRFPPTGVASFHYLNEFKIDTASVFPDPGIVNTEIHFQGIAHKWHVGTNPPALFEKVDRGWKCFLAEGVIIEGKKFQAPSSITQALRERRLMDAKKRHSSSISIFLVTIVNLTSCSSKCTNLLAWQPSALLNGNAACLNQHGRIVLNI